MTRSWSTAYARPSSLRPSGVALSWNFALWALQAVLALMFAMAGFAKVGGDAAMVKMFATIGIGQWLRYLVGTLEIVGALGVLVPRVSGLAALGLLAVSGLVAWGRRGRLRGGFEAIPTRRAGAKSRR